MTNIKGIILILFFGLSLSAQVIVTADIPAEVTKNSEILVNIKFDKGPIKNYSKYELLVPEGMGIKEVDCNYGAFSFENNKMRVIWAITPANPVYTIQIKLSTGSETGAKQLNQSYAYAEKGEKLELEMAKIKFSVVDNLSSGANEESSKPEEVVAVAEDSKQEAAEIKNETKEAEEIGLTEKIEAEKKIAEAKDELRKAELISNPSEKKATIEAANQKMQKAEEELAAAERILTLSGSLNASATIKENIGQSIDSVAKAESIQANTTDTVDAASINHHPSEKIEKAKETAMNKGAEEAQDLYKSIKPEEHDDSQIEQQVSQLRLDSRDALDVGTREKLKAETALHDAYEALKKTKYIPDAEEKKLAVDKANTEIEQAKSDLEIASKILTLSKSLEENAKEIERLHLADNTKADTSQSAIAAAHKHSEPTATGDDRAKVSAVEKKSARTPKEEIPEPKKELPTEKPKENKAVVAKNSSSGNTAFTLQLGCFVNSPDMSVFKKLGKVQLRSENGKYKVYYGKFKNKQDAVDMRLKTVAKGFDCFVVTLPNKL